MEGRVESDSGERQELSSAQPSRFAVDLSITQAENWSEAQVRRTSNKPDL